MSRPLSSLEPDVEQRVRELLRMAADQGIDVQVASTRRSCAEQHDLFARGVTKADGCRSWHVWGRAVDLVVLDGGKPNWNGSDPRYRQLGDMWESIGGYWGGRFADPGHYQFAPSPTPGSRCPDPSRCDEIVGAWPDAPPQPSSPPGDEPEGQDSSPVPAALGAAVLLAVAIGVLA